ncbi:MAG TPA: protocatechuate 3,4-dioxygenase subunit beta [Bryobacteraceae bacterium]
MKPAVHAEPQTTYRPYDDRTQMARQIERYPLSFTRVPSQPLIERPLTLSELTGPCGINRRLGSEKLDLSYAAPGGPRALGQLISVAGRVTDEDGSPIAGAVIEIWQANSSGKYIHALDRFDAPLDSNFTGQGHLITDSEGRYEFLSVKPGAYPVLESGWWWRPPHIHFSIFGLSWMNRYVTQIFFPGEPLNEIDLLLNGVRDEEARESLIFEAPAPEFGAVKLLPYQRNFVLRGKRATPQLA